MFTLLIETKDLYSRNIQILVETHTLACPIFKISQFSIYKLSNIIYNSFIFNILHIYSLILYQSKNCGHRIHVLFMMYDVYWYCQMKKKRLIMKILKKEWFIWQFWKKGGSREKGEEETKSMPHAPVIEVNVWIYWLLKKKIIFTEPTDTDGI
jgi:hypothetical protein